MTQIIHQLQMEEPIMDSSTQEVFHIITATPAADITHLGLPLVLQFHHALIKRKWYRIVAYNLKANAIGV